MCLAVGALTGCSGPEISGVAASAAVESSAPTQLGPGGSVRITFPAAYALSRTTVGRVDAVACDRARDEWRGTATVEDQFIGEKTRPVAWTFDGTGAAEVQAGPFTYGLSSGEHYVLFVLHLRRADSAIIVDRVSAVQPGFPPAPGDATTPPPPFPVTLGPVPGC
jgi:hypothetical protein